MDAIGESGLDVISIGKIYDIFSGAGIQKSLPTHNNGEGMQTLLEVQKTDFNGLCFANLVDFDMLYGHRQDIDGYANALTAFDAWLPEFMKGTPALFIYTALLSLALSSLTGEFLFI